VIPKRSFGSSGVDVSEIGFGAWTLGLDWWGKVDPADAKRLVARAIDLGITFFDTADTYGAGVGEERLAETLGGRRGDVVLGTKVGYDITVPHDQSKHSERPQRWDPAFIRERCEESLRRLGTDVIDVYELHNPRMPQIRDDDIFATLEELKTAGKIRCYGVALGPAIGWEAEGVEAVRTRAIDVVQTVFNLLEQRPGDVFLAEANSRVGTIARVPHASDALVGKFKRDDLNDTLFPANDHRSFRKRAWMARALAKVEQLDFLLDGRTIGQAAIAWILANPGITTVLPTVTTAEQLEEYAAAAARPLSAEEFDRVQDLYSRDFGLPPENEDERTELRATATAKAKPEPLTGIASEVG
jgi:aryl-alcohol dehydrogenase-like predicted oxidoreductase